jgi:hypothetical protein
MTDQMTETTKMPEEKPVQMNETTKMPEEKPDTYHDHQALVRIADIAGWLSWLFLLLFVLVAGIIGYLVYYFIHNKIAFEQFLLTLPTFLVPFFLGGFFWVALKAIDEAIYLFLDIEDNTRR